MGYVSRGTGRKVKRDCPAEMRRIGGVFIVWECEVVKVRVCVVSRETFFTHLPIFFWLSLLVCVK
jgi:hypothetical protein